MFEQRLVKQIMELTKVHTVYYELSDVPADVRQVVTMLEQSPTNTAYYLNHEIDKYLAVGNWHDHQLQGVVITGPFLANIDWTNFDSSNLAQRSRLLSQRLSMLSEDEINNIAAVMLELFQQTTDPVHLVFQAEVQPYVVHEQAEISQVDEEIVNARFKEHHALAAAIAHGDLAMVTHLMDEQQLESFFMPFTGRVPNRPLRAAKNIAFVHNTMGRMAAEQGGLRPIYLHLTSEKYAVKIEQARSIEAVWQLIKAFDYEYCRLVQEYGDGQYSREVNDAINYVRLRFAESLTLAAIATAIKVDPYVLSRKFKQETQQTLFAFIKSERVRHAQELLRQDHLTIGEVAIRVGFNDQGYFSKCFKAVTGKTPLAYTKGL